MKTKHPSEKGILPFLFRKECIGGEDKWFVKIASIDYMFYDSHWMHDKYLGDSCMVPDVDYCVDEIREFVSEETAIAFIRNWWR